MREAPELLYTVHAGPEPSDAATSSWPDYGQALAQAVTDWTNGGGLRILVRCSNGQVMWDSDHKLDVYIQQDEPPE